MDLTMHQWIFIGIVSVIALVFAWGFLELLGQFSGTNAFGALFIVLAGLVLKLGPVALIIYGIWAFFIDGRV